MTKEHAYAYETGYKDGYATRDTEIVRCRDCVHYIDGECMAEDGNGDYLRLAVPPTHFCAWGERDLWVTCKCGESIELGDRESAVCPSCGRTVRE